MRLIDADAVRDALYDADAITMKGVAIINQFPTIEAKPVVHGRWENVNETSLYVPDMKYTVTHTAETCSACKVRIGFIGSKPYLYDNICPNCGAKMDGRSEGE